MKIIELTPGLELCGSHLVTCLSLPQVSDLEAAQLARFEALEASHSRSLKEHAAELTLHEEQLRVMVATHETTLSERAVAHAAEVDTLKQSLSSQLCSQTTAHEQALASYDERMAALAE